MYVVVPFSPERPKTRLAPALAADEREALAWAMLADVLEAVRETGHTPTVLTTAPLEPPRVPETDHLADDLWADLETVVDDRPLSTAVNALLEAAEDSAALVMADLALATPDALETLFAADADVAIAPGRGGGTNALVVRHPGFRVDYHGTSYLDHHDRVRAIGASLESVDSFRLATDVDEPADLVEVLVHTDGYASTVLERLGFSLTVTDGRVGLER
ncbi:2-phospho-L-lactate guanylyltransferase [Natronobiforma cellulositropha]|uniref:2-phospho-L-lactate guanylyltransferase n=1 Tax=Natronobiforma cellulositropha TaxID=1679076 RepID=UPI0021D57316|nr:2-phospho-L-lactate guanylyltransferase [Natronobiforma cellulositropha]